MYAKVNGGISGDPADPGESPEQALRRELFEEADATIVALEALGSQRMDDPQTGREYHRVYWCRVTLARQDFPRAESTLRHIIAPADLLDTLSWGRSDPKAPMLLELAAEARS